MNHTIMLIFLQVPILNGLKCMYRCQGFGGTPIYHSQPGSDGLRRALSVAHLGDRHALVTLVEANKRCRILFSHVV